MNPEIAAPRPPVIALLALLSVSSAPPTPLAAVEVVVPASRLGSSFPATDQRFGSRVAIDRHSDGNPDILVATNGADGAAVFRYLRDDDFPGWKHDQTLSFAESDVAALDHEGGVGLVAASFPEDDNPVYSVVDEGLDTLLWIPGEVAAVSVHWDFFAGTVVVGQPGHAGGAGRVSVYEGFFGEEFTLVEQFVGGAGHRLGTSLALADSVLVAGAPGAGPNGRVRIFLRIGDDWQSWQTLESPAASQFNAEFGAVLDVSPDAQWIAVGSPEVDRVTTPGSAEDIGAVYVYRSNFLEWELSELLRPAGAGAHDRFGTSVALHGIGLVAGSPGWDDELANQGAAHVFHLSGDDWKESLRLVDSSPGADDLLGSSVALGDLGALVGAPRRDSGEHVDSGLVTFYPGVAGLFVDGFESGDPSSWSDAVP